MDGIALAVQAAHAALGPLLLACAPLIAPDTARALIQVESAGNPLAIGVVGGALARQPASLPEALATVAALEAAGWNYSLGLGQINKRNFKRLGLSPSTAFEPCANLAAMQAILGECFARASRRAPSQAALRNAFSCYYSGNFLTGHQHGYVAKVLAAWLSKAPEASRPAGARPSQADPRAAVAGLPFPNVPDVPNSEPPAPALKPAAFASTHPGPSP